MRIAVPYLLFLLCCFAFEQLGAQTALNTKVSSTEVGKSLPELFSTFEKKVAVRFYYLPGWIDKILIEDQHKDRELGEVLNELFTDTDLHYVTFSDHDIVILKDPARSIAITDLIKTAMREGRVIDRVSFGTAADVRKGKQVTLKGRIVDSETKDPLNGATIVLGDAKLATVSDANGNFVLKMPAGEHLVSFAFLNFEERITDLRIYADGEMEVLLARKATVLEEITISEIADRAVVTSNLGLAQISIRDLKRAPSFMGEVDVIKQLQAMPGVTTSGEAASGFNVRGGGVDQNLVLYEGQQVFNTAHAFGFFSAFNTQAIRTASFYRGGMPAEYGGRISSVLDLRAREGDYEKWNVNGGIGIIAANLMASGPIKKDKTSIALSARSTYSDWLINSIQTNYADLKNSSLSFYDGTLKLGHRFTQKTKLTVSGYASQDQFHIKGDSSYQWNSVLGAARIDHEFSPNTTLDFTLGLGSYSYKVKDRNTFNGFDLSYRITYPSLRMAIHTQTGAHRLVAGLESVYYAFEPGTLKPFGDQSAIRSIRMEQQQSLESAAFVSDGITIHEKLSVEAGVRVSSFTSFGPATVNVYAPNQPLETFTRIDSLRFGSGQSMKTYFGLEPRLSVRYSLNKSTSIKAGYQRTYQYLHLITNTTAITPVDIWQPSGYYFKPQHADQFSVGLFRDIRSGKYEAFIEGYYKNINNILDFKDGANLILNKHLETDLLQGQGRTFGVETSITKVSGRLIGSISYTYSRSLRTINGPTDRESINHGMEYPSNFDQPNIVNVTWKYALSRRFYFTGNFTYRTGRPVTAPQSAFDIDHVPVVTFSDRNAYRIPDYHRLDVALIVEEGHRLKKPWSGSWSFSIYNVYGRKNPYTVYFSAGPSGSLRPYQLSIIGTVLPSISYSFKF